jgi:hypothetical protein
VRGAGGPFGAPLQIKRPKRKIEIAVRASSWISPVTRTTFRGQQTARSVRVELHRVRQSGRIACAVIDGVVVLDASLERWLS